MLRAGLCILAVLATSAAAAEPVATEPFSIKCWYKSFTYPDPEVTYSFTFQPGTGKVITQWILGGSRYPGKVTARSERLTEFHIRYWSDRRDFVWDRMTGFLAIVAVPGDDARPAEVDFCERTDPLVDLALFETNWDWD